ncbi:MAG: hypothetical protein AB1567_03910 [bacterium]
MAKKQFHIHFKRSILLITFSALAIIIGTSLYSLYASSYKGSKDTKKEEVQMIIVPIAKKSTSEIITSEESLSAEELWKKSNEYFAKEMYLEASEYLQECISINDEYKWKHYDLAQQYYETGKYEKAVKEMEMQGVLVRDLSSVAIEDYKLYIRALPKEDQVKAWDVWGAVLEVNTPDEYKETMENLKKKWDQTPPEMKEGQIAYGEFPQWSPDGTKIMFKREEHLYVINSDGSDEKIVATNIICRGRWLPDGRIIWTESLPQGLHEEWVINADGTNEKLYENQDKIPLGNGKILYIYSDANYRGEILVLDERESKGSHSNWDYHKIPSTFVIFSSFEAKKSEKYITLFTSLSPDKKKLLYTLTYHITDAEIIDKTPVWLVDLVNNRKEELTNYGKFPTWSPNGKYIFYVQPLNTNEDKIKIINEDKKGIVTLTTKSKIYEDIPLSWSPDSSRIAFVTGDYEKQSLWLMDSCEGKQFEVANEIRNFKWAPTEDIIAYIDNKGIWIVDKNGIKKTIIVADNDIWNLDWSPDSKKIVYVKSNGLFIKKINW